MNNRERVERRQPCHDQLRPIINLIIHFFAVAIDCIRSFEKMTIAFKGRSILKVESHRNQTNMAIKPLLLSQSLGHIFSITVWLYRPPFKILISKLNVFFEKNLVLKSEY